ncbi:hypothetical protein [Dokdonella sp.]|uniref:hypothetical protein n=1 Tax=Dokdonella sp. TaxID=2291710 RepID=UPI0031C1599A|nr:hypothetical protein [Dokdonella sp.]
MNPINARRLAACVLLGLLMGGSALAAAAEPAAGTACGRISTFDVAPRQQDLHAAVIISVDGELPGPRNADAWRVTPGKHVLKVAERIDSKYLSFNNRQRNAGDPYRTLDVDVPADTTVLVAARLLSSTDAASGAWWEPVAWKEVHEPCR